MLYFYLVYQPCIQPRDYNLTELMVCLDHVGGRVQQARLDQLESVDKQVHAEPLMESDLSAQEGRMALQVQPVNVEKNEEKGPQGDTAGVVGILGRFLPFPLALHYALNC